MSSAIEKAYEEFTLRFGTLVPGVPWEIVVSRCGFSFDRKISKNILCRTIASSLGSAGERVTSMKSDVLRTFLSRDFAYSLEKFRYDDGPRLLLKAVMLSSTGVGCRLHLDNQKSTSDGRLCLIYSSRAVQDEARNFDLQEGC